MKFKIYKIKGIGHIYFSKAFYTLPCEKDTIFKLCRKLGIKNTCVIITDLSKEYLKQFQQDEGKEVKVSQNRNFGYDVYVKIKKECDIPSVINKALESEAEDIFILDNVETIQLHEIIEKFEEYSLEQLIRDRIILSVFVIRAYENEIFYLYDTERKSIEEGKYFVLSK